MAVLNRMANDSRMQALKEGWPRLQFAWQRSPLRQPWFMALLALTLVLVVMLAQAWWTSQHWQQQMQTKLVEPQHLVQARLQPGVTSAGALASAAPVLAQWPSEEEADRISAEILALADAMGMVFDRAEFQSGASAQSELYVQRIKLPLSGDYVQLRHFLALVLQRYPSLALAQLKLQRTDVQQPGLEAYVEFNLYTRKRRPS